MRRALLGWPVLVLLALNGCSWSVPGLGHHGPCTPPAGGRCAADVAWPGPIQVSVDGLRLHGPILCGGVLRADESSSTVTIRLHIGAIGPGAMSCARADVAVRLSEPLGGRRVVDAVSGQTVRVVHRGTTGSRPTLRR